MTKYLLGNVVHISCIRFSVANIFPVRMLFAHSIECACDYCFVMIMANNRFHMPQMFLQLKKFNCRSVTSATNIVQTSVDSHSRHFPKQVPRSFADLQPGVLVLHRMWASSSPLAK
jgi:hypothetical protein